MRKVSTIPKVYRLESLLGEGLNSRVYKAICSDQEKNIEQLVALKILKSKNLVEVWRQEFSKLSRVRSIYCVSTYGWESVEGKPSLILEYINGLTLEELARREALSKWAIKEIVAQVYLGLKDLEKFGVSHGDLSPSNILISETGNIKLIDFGLLGKNGDWIEVTPEFAAPEILKGGTPNLSTDLMSLDLIATSLGGSEVQVDIESPTKPRRSKKGRLELQKKVQAILSHRNKPLLRTRQISLEEVSSFSHLRAGILVLLISFLFQWPHANSLEQTKTGFLSVKTHQWLLLEVNGKNLGYAPVSHVGLAPGDYNLRWRSGSGHGSRALTIEEGQHIVLGDKDFND